MIQWTNLKQALSEFGEALKANYQEQLEQQDINASENLSRCDYDVKVNGEKYEVTLDLKKYWYWVECGRQPGRVPPLQPFLDWVKVKKSLPRIEKPERFANAIRWSLTSEANGGGGKVLEGRHPLEKAREKTIDGFNERISEAISKDITAWLNS